MKELFDQLEYLFREVLWGGTGGQESHEDTELKEEEEEPTEDGDFTFLGDGDFPKDDLCEGITTESWGFTFFTFLGFTGEERKGVGGRDFSLCLLLGICIIVS